MKQTLIGIVVLIVLAVGGWYAYSSGAFKNPGTTASSTPSGNETVATVNGTNITRDQLNNAEATLAAQAGVSTSSLDASTTAQLQTQALDSLISQELLTQAAQQGGYTASSTVVDAQIAALKSQVGGDAQYQQALQSRGLTENQLRAQISQSLTIQNYLEATLHLSTVTASQTEIQTLYNQLKAQNTGTTTPPLSKVQDQVKQLVIGQKQQQQAAQLVQQLRAQSNVKILI